MTGRRSFKDVISGPSACGRLVMIRLACMGCVTRARAGLQPLAPGYGGNMFLREAIELWSHCNFGTAKRHPSRMRKTSLMIRNPPVQPLAVARINSANQMPDIDTHLLNSFLKASNSANRSRPNVAILSPISDLFHPDNISWWIYVSLAQSGLHHPIYMAPEALRT